MPSPKPGLPGEAGYLAVWLHVCLARRGTRSAWHHHSFSGRPVAHGEHPDDQIRQQGHQEMAAGKVGLPGRPALEPITPPVPLPPA